MKEHPELYEAHDHSDDWHAVEEVLNSASDGASEPFYSQVEAAKASLFRLGSAAQDGGKTLEVMFAVLPALIVEAAEDFRQAWLDGRTPELNEEAINARLHRIVTLKFSESANSQSEPA